MVSHKKLVSVYLPEEVYQSLIAYQQQQGLEEASEAVVKILAQFFHQGGEVKRYATVEQLESLEGKVTYLSEQVALLSQIIPRNAPTEAALTAIAVDKEHTHPTPAAQQPAVTVVNTFLEEEDEEPDEILYDFLEPNSSPSPSQPPAAAVVRTSIEEEEDEPDEILYDFLEPNSSSSPSQPPAAAAGSTSIEEEEDEPDEILYDFLEPNSSPSPSQQQ
ncbi:MAG: hypothetical protein ICV63_03690 [Coleofasciculus sp. Co-bin14]|nr:hypothetical protein [Coleofasciculus sp. Co-bin14]